MASTSGAPPPESPNASIGARYAQRAPPSPASRSTEAGRARTLRRDKDNFSTLQERSKKIATQGPYKIRPPVKISTKTIDTDTIGRVNKGNQKMSQFLYSLANEPSVGLFHVNDHVRRTVPRLVETRKQIDFQSVELDKSSCDVDEILPTVRSIGSLTAFKSMQSILLRSLQLTVSRSPTPSASSSQRSLGPPTPNRGSQPSSPSGSQRHFDSPAPSTTPAPNTPEMQREPIVDHSPSELVHANAEEAHKETIIIEEASLPSMDAPIPHIITEEDTSTIEAVKPEPLPAKAEEDLEALEISPPEIAAVESSEPEIAEQHLESESPASDTSTLEESSAPAATDIQSEVVPASEPVEPVEPSVTIHEVSEVAPQIVEASAEQVDTEPVEASLPEETAPAIAEPVESLPPPANISPTPAVAAAPAKGQGKKKKKGGARAQNESDPQPKAF